MKKRFFIILTALFIALTGYALSNGEFVYTPQGRFQITGANAASSNFADFTGWTLISSSDGALLETTFDIVANGYADGLNSAISLNDAVTEGMYFKFVPTNSSASYVVSFKMKGAALASIRLTNEGFNGSNASLGDVLKNCVKIEGNADNVYGGTTDVVVCNTGEELTEDWQTFNYAIVGDGISRTYFLVLKGMQTTVEIADLQIAPAVQIADLRQRDAMLEKLNVYKNCYEWDAALLEDMGIDEVIELLGKIGDESSQSELDELLNTAQEALDAFVNENMDDFLVGNNDNYLGIKTTSGNTQKVSNLGDWTATTTGRAFWSNGGYPDLGHYQRGSKWNYNDPTSAMGVYMQKTLEKGSYVFAIEAKAAMREDASQSWYVNEGLKPAYGVAYIVNVETTDTIATVVKDLDPVKFTPFYIPTTIVDSCAYVIGFNAYCKEAYQDLTLGSVVYVANASLRGKTGNQYNQKQLQYEADVREQITAGRNNLETAKENIASADYYWGKLELQTCVDSVETKIAAYELWDQDSIIATYQEDYVKSTSAETGYMVYEVYQTAVKDIIAANRKFVAVNDTLNSLQVAIDDAKTTLAMRLYSAATGKEDLQSAIADAEDLLASLKRMDYSEDNAFFITSMIEALSDAVDAFKASVPAEVITTIVDIDFENEAYYDNWIDQYYIDGAVGTMVFNTYNGEGAENSISFEKGFWSNGELILSDVLRVGNGFGTVTFDPTNGTGSMDSNILKVEFDYYYGSLSGKNAGFYIYNGETEAAALFISKYSGTEVVNTFGLDRGLIPAVGSSAANNDAICVKTNKTHFEIVFDFGEKSMYCSTNANGKSQTSEKKPFAEATLTSFVVKSNYNNSGRRCWFDNLKIERIAAGEPIIEEKTWTVAGMEDICGSFWNPEDTSNDMTTVDGANYTLAKDSVVLEAGVSYQYKVVADHSWAESYPYDNASFTVSENGIYSLRFNFNSDYKELYVDYWKTGDIETPNIEKVWTIAGYGEVLKSEWDPADVSNDMTSLSDGSFQLVKKNVELMAYCNYEYKVVANHSWDENYGQYGEFYGNNAYFSVDKDGLYDVTFYWNPNYGDLYATTKIVSVSDNANVLYGTENQKFTKGQIQRLGIGMNNDEQITAFQFDIVLPRALTINGISDNYGSYMIDVAYTNRARVSHIIDAEYQNDGSIRVIGYSSQNDAFRYYDGELLNIGVAVQDWVSNGDYYVTLKNIRLINTEGKEFKPYDTSFVITVSGLKGDANNDGQVTMSDVVAIVNYVLGQANANFNFYNADVNGNGDVTMADVVGVVNIVMGKTAAGARMTENSADMAPGTLSLSADADRMSVVLDNTAAYTAFQMDVTLPEGMSINDVAFTGRATTSHVLSMNTLDNGKVRITGWSARNADLKGNSGELFTMNLSGLQMVGTVTVDNVLFVTANGMEHKLNGAEIFGETTGISQMKNGEWIMDNSYDLQGRKVNSQQKKGLYIINNKKVVVK